MSRTIIKVNLEVEPIDMDKVRRFFKEHENCEDVSIGFHEVAQCEGFFKLFPYLWCLNCITKAFIYNSSEESVKE